MKLYPNFGLFFCVIAWIIGILILILNSLYPFNFLYSYFWFWTAITLCSSSALLLILTSNNSEKTVIPVLIFWGLTLFLPQFLRSPMLFISRDELFHFQTLNLLNQSGNTHVISTVFNISLNYPGLELLTLSSKLFSGLTTFQSAIVIIAIIHSLLLLLLYVFFKTISLSIKISGIGAFLYAANSRFTYFDSLFSYQTIAVVLLLFAMIVISKFYWEKVKRSFFLFYIPILPAIIVSHHVTTYVLILFLLVFMIFYRKNKGINHSDSKLPFIGVLLATLVLTLAWVIYDAIPTIAYMKGLIVERLSFISQTITLQQTRPLFIGSTLPNFEVFIDRFLYLPLIFGLISIGFWLIFKKKNNRNFYLDSMFVLGPLLFFFSLPLIFTSSSDLAYRSWTFSFIGVALFGAFAIDWLFSNGTLRLKGQSLFKVLTIAIVVLIMIGGISLSLPTAVRFNAPSNVETIGSTGDAVASATWFQNHFGMYNYIVGDKTTRDIFGSYGYQYVRVSSASDVFFPTTVNNVVFSNLRSYNESFLVTNLQMLNHLGEGGSYFGTQELGNNGGPVYGETEPLPAVSLQKFDNSTLFNRIYSGENINIYKINLH